MTLAIVLCAIVWGAVACGLLGSCITLGGPDASEVIGSILWPLALPWFVGVFAVQRWRKYRNRQAWTREIDA